MKMFPAFNAAPITARENCQHFCRHDWKRFRAIYLQIKWFWWILVMSIPSSLQFLQWMSKESFICDDCWVTGCWHSACYMASYNKKPRTWKIQVVSFTGMGSCFHTTHAIYTLSHLGNICKLYPTSAHFTKNETYTGVVYLVTEPCKNLVHSACL